MANQHEIKFEQPSPLLLLANQNMWMIWGGIMLVIFALGYFFVLQPQISSIVTSNASLNDINVKDQAAKDLAANIETLTKSFNTLEASRNSDLQKLHSIVPQGEQLAELFVLAEKLAQRRGMSLDSIDVSGLEANTKKPAVDKSVPNPEATTTKTVDTDQKLQAMSINMAVAQIEANPNIDVYTEFKSYLDDLESSVRLLDIESVSFSGSEDGLLSMNFTMKTYFVPIIK